MTCEPTFRTLCAVLLVGFLSTAPATAQDDVWDDAGWDDDAASTLPISGFVEAGVGTRIRTDSLLDQRGTLEELRWRVEHDWQPTGFNVALKADLGYDGVDGEAYANLRDLSVGFTLGDSADVRVGRQILTWGTGDLVFLNDLFPKDFVSFFAGRDDEYLKAPSDTIRFTRYSDRWNLDFAWTPEFAHDTYLDGDRFSFFFPLAGRNVAPNPVLRAEEPHTSFENGEFAARLFRTVEGREYAVYGYHGFFKQPNALTPDLRATFAPLTSLGASLRQPFRGGIVNLEAAYYWSRDDSSGRDPLIPNDQLRVLAGYEWEPRTNFTVGLQYYLEWTLDHDRLLDNSLAPGFEPDEWRHLLTTRLTYRAARDKHVLSLFAFVSPSDRDVYLRPSYTYRHSDQWSWFLGGNLFAGDAAHTFFGQLEDASNLYLRVRYHY